MGAIPLEDSTSFRVWRRNASSVAVVGEFNDWNAEANPLEREENGLWARTVQGAKAGQQYQYEITNGDKRFKKNDAYAREIHAKTALGVIYADDYEWKSPGNETAELERVGHLRNARGTFVPGPHGSQGRFEQVIGRLPVPEKSGGERARDHAADGLSGRAFVGLQPDQSVRHRSRLRRTAGVSRS